MLIKSAFVTNSSSSAYLILGFTLTEDDFYGMEERYLEHLMDMGTPGSKDTLLEIVDAADRGEMIPELHKHFYKKLYGEKPLKFSPEYDSYPLEDLVTLRSFYSSEGDFRKISIDKLSFTEDDQEQLKRFCECVGIEYKEPGWYLLDHYG